MTRRRTLLTTLLLCGAPAVALANAGTALMWGTSFHLMIGNLFLGIFEGVLLAWFCGLRKLRSIAVMVPANYFSAIVGLQALGRIRTVIALDLNNAWFWVWAAIGRDGGCGRPGPTRGRNSASGSRCLLAIG